MIEVAPPVKPVIGEFVLLLSVIEIMAPTFEIILNLASKGTPPIPLIIGILFTSPKLEHFRGGTKKRP